MDTSYFASIGEHVYVYVCVCVCVCVWCTLVRVSPPQVVQVTDEAKFSSSAVDTKAFLLQMGSFWQNLSWPVASEAYGFTVTIIQAGGIRIVFV